MFFELTKDEKAARAKQLGLDVFIDDLPEILALPDLAGMRRILFADGAMRRRATTRSPGLGRDFAPAPRRRVMSGDEPEVLAGRLARSGRARAGRDASTG